MFERASIDSLFKFLVEFKIEVEGSLSKISMFASSGSSPNLEKVFNLSATKVSTTNTNFSIKN